MGCKYSSLKKLDILAKVKLTTSHGDSILSTKLSTSLDGVIDLLHNYLKVGNPVCNSQNNNKRSKILFNEYF